MSKPATSIATWSPADHAYLEAGCGYGLSAEEIAWDMGRSADAVMVHAERRGYRIKRKISCAASYMYNEDIRFRGQADERSR